MDVGILLAIIIPPVLIDTAMKVYATINLTRSMEKRSEANKIGWLIGIWVINTIGWLSYLLFGRIPSEKKKDEETWD